MKKANNNTEHHPYRDFAFGANCSIRRAMMIVLPFLAVIAVMGDRAYLLYQEANKVRKPKSLITEALKPPTKLITEVLEMLSSANNQLQGDSKVGESLLTPEVVLPDGTIISREEERQMTNQNSTLETSQL